MPGFARLPGTVLLLVSAVGCVTVPRGGSPVPRFEDRTESMGLAGLRAAYVNWLDADNDGWPDLLLDGHRLFRNRDGEIFEECTDGAGLKGVKPGRALACDVDNDGWTDIVTVRGGLWMNDAGRGFSDAAERFGFAPNPKGSVIGAGDVDGDGFVDLFVGMGEDWNGGNADYYPHELWLNQQGRGFREIGESAGIAAKTYARAVLFSDVDGDGRTDIFIGNYRLQPNALWVNQGQSRFRNEADLYGVAGTRDPKMFYDPVTKQNYGYRYGHTIGACWFDMDNDGKLDLFTANLVHKYVGPSSRKGMRYDIRGYVCDDSGIFRRDRVGFTDWRVRLGVPPKPIGGRGVYRGDELWSGCAAGDVNNDGWQDVFVPQIYNLSYARARLFVNHRGLSFVDAAEEAGVRRIDTYAGAWADVDRDGWLDLVTGGRPEKGAPPSLVLYRNTTAQTETGRDQHWLKIALPSGPDQPTRCGVRVTVEYGGRTQLLEWTAGTSSHGQQNDPILHFGLGREARGTARIRAVWPSGRASELRSPPNRCVRME